MSRYIMHSFALMPFKAAFRVQFLSISLLQLTITTEMIINT